MFAPEDYEVAESDAVDISYRNYNEEYDSQYIGELQDGLVPLAGNIVPTPAAASAPVIPDFVKNFIIVFHRALAEGNVKNIESIYDSGFTKVTEKFYKSSPWPAADTIAPLVDNDAFFITLYKELYYRHIYSRLQPTLEQRFESFENYCDLFDFLVNREHPVTLELPNSWLWDIIDEFIYQFQTFCRYKSKLDNKSEAELAFLQDHPQVWDVDHVLVILHTLAEKSNINQQLNAQRTFSANGTAAGNEAALNAIAGEFGSHPLYKMLGFFSLIGLCRLHCQLGDYYQALKVLDSVEINRKNLFAKQLAYQITIHYYVAFAYLMMRRYQDSIRTLSSILVSLIRTKALTQRSGYQHEQNLKKIDQIYSLLAIAISICPQKLDENVQNALKDKIGYEKLQKLSKGDEAIFEEFFVFSCPKFISPVPTPGNDNVWNAQIKLFLSEVRQQVFLPTIRSYLKLYTTMPVAKLASFLDIDEETCRTHLFSYKNKMRSIVWTQGPPLSGELFSSSDIDFYLDKDMIHIADTKVARRYGEFYIRQINKFDDLSTKR